MEQKNRVLFMLAVILRKAHASDLEFVADLGMRTMADSVASYKQRDPIMLARSFAMLQDVVLQRVHEIIIAECDGRRAGFAMLLIDYEDEVTLAKQAYLAFLAVEPTMRQNGIGTHLLHAAEAAASDYGLSHISLMVTAENDIARRLYESAGYAAERLLMFKKLGAKPA